jgi:vacuolar-type H+-ATPase subunit H
MSLDNILKNIIADAQAEAEKIILESQKKAAQIKEKASKEASELAEALIKETERQGRLEASRIITQARLERKIGILSCKKEIIQEVLNNALKKGGKGTKGLKRKVIMKGGEREEPYDEERLKEELRSRLESEILEALKI